MSLFLSKTWEHALLAMVVKDAADVADRQGGYLGRTAVQKIVYFLQVLNVPMRYRFEVSHFGPFCNSILGDLEWLIADEVIADDSPDPQKYSKYIPGASCEELLSMHAAKLSEYNQTFKSTVSVLLPLKPDHLELIATLDYSFRELRASAGKVPAKRDVIGRFREFKGTKFRENEVAETYDRLEKAGLFE